MCILLLKTVDTPVKHLFSVYEELLYIFKKLSGNNYLVFNEACLFSSDSLVFSYKHFKLEINIEMHRKIKSYIKYSIISGPYL